VAEEHEVAVAQPAQEVAPLAHRVGVDRRRAFLHLGGEGERPGPHGRPVVHRGADVSEGVEHPIPQRLDLGRVPLPVDLHVDVGHLVDDGMDDDVHADPAARQGQRDRVDQEGHVVGDGLDHRVGRHPAVLLEGRVVDGHRGGAGQAPVPQPVVGQSGTVKVDGRAADDVLGGDPLPVAPQELLRQPAPPGRHGLIEEGGLGRFQLGVHGP
jgi:hypothetical protein